MVRMLVVKALGERGERFDIGHAPFDGEVRVRGADVPSAFAWRDGRYLIAATDGSRVWTFRLRPDEEVRIDLRTLARERG